MRANALRQK